MEYVGSSRDVDGNESHHILYLKYVNDSECALLNELGYKYVSSNPCDDGFDEEMFVKTEKVVLI